MYEISIWFIYILYSGYYMSTLVSIYQSGSLISFTLAIICPHWCPCINLAPLYPLLWLLYVHTGVHVSIWLLYILYSGYYMSTLVSMYQSGSFISFTLAIICSHRCPSINLAPLYPLLWLLYVHTGVNVSIWLLYILFSGYYMSTLVSMYQSGSFISFSLATICPHWCPSINLAPLYPLLWLVYVHTGVHVSIWLLYILLSGYYMSTLVSMYQSGSFSVKPYGLL